LNDNRKRKKQILIRLTDEEHEMLLQRMGMMGAQNQAAYLRSMALTGYNIKLDLSEVRETLRLISNVANNINQVTKRANETRSIYGNDLIKLYEEVSELRKQVSDVMKVFWKVEKLLEL